MYSARVFCFAQNTANNNYYYRFGRERNTYRKSCSLSLSLFVSPNCCLLQVRGIAHARFICTLPSPHHPRTPVYRLNGGSENKYNSRRTFVWIQPSVIIASKSRVRDRPVGVRNTPEGPRNETATPFVPSVVDSANCNIHVTIIWWSITRARVPSPVVFPRQRLRRIPKKTCRRRFLISILLLADYRFRTSRFARALESAAIIVSFAIYPNHRDRNCAIKTSLVPKLVPIYTEQRSRTKLLPTDIFSW